MESLGKRHYLQSEDPGQYLNSSQEKKTAGMMAQDQERMYAQIGTLDTTLQPNQIFYNAQYDIDTMGKVPRELFTKPALTSELPDSNPFFSPENPDDIYPYATFVLPEADCGAANKVQLAAAYQEVPDNVKQQRQQLVLNPQENLVAAMPQVSTLVFQEQSTLPLSDACSKSVRLLRLYRIFSGLAYFLTLTEYQSVSNGGQHKHCGQKAPSSPKKESFDQAANHGIGILETTNDITKK